MRPSAVIWPHLPIDNSARRNNPARGGFHSAGAKALSLMRVQPSTRRDSRCSQNCNTSRTMRLSTCWHARTSKTLRLGHDRPMVFNTQRRNCEAPSRPSFRVCRVSACGNKLSFSAFLATKMSKSSSSARRGKRDNLPKRTFFGPYLMSFWASRRTHMCNRVGTPAAESADTLLPTRVSHMTLVCCSPHRCVSPTDPPALCPLAALAHGAPPHMG
mmetsp:Transcript_58135/g.162050  ORF Transcript_58135/g.162050 Transcript_58135/m.162050 type:complete len:215 (-) Transcript_58135:162-806(-)